MAYDYLIPYDTRDGNVIAALHEVPEEFREWRENLIFYDTLKFISFFTKHIYRSRGYRWESETIGASYRMLGQDVPKLLRKAVVRYGKVEGYWRIGKSGGPYYGVSYVTTDKVPKKFIAEVEQAKIRLSHSPSSRNEQVQCYVERGIRVENRGPTIRVSQEVE